MIEPIMIEDKTTKSNVSILFRILIRFCVFPVKADFQKNTIKLKLCSKEILIYMTYLSLLSTSTFVTFFILGENRFWVYVTDTMERATVTENISVFGTFITLLVFGVYFITFMKKLGTYQHNSFGSKNDTNNIFSCEASSRSYF